MLEPKDIALAFFLTYVVPAFIAGAVVAGIGILVWRCFA